MRDEWKGSKRNGQLAHQSNLLLTALRGRGDFCKETKNWLSKQSIFTISLYRGFYVSFMKTRNYQLGQASYNGTRPPGSSKKFDVKS